MTHIDLDHIGGAIELLRDRSLGVTYSDVWFNDFRHLSDEPQKRGALQGEFLSVVFGENKLPWNEVFDNGPVVVPDAGALSSVRLPDDRRLIRLSPSPEKLHELQQDWEQTLRQENMTPGDRAAAARPASRPTRPCPSGDGDPLPGRL